MTILANVIFYNFLFFLGRGFLNLSDLILKRKNKSHKIIFGLPQSTFYVFFGLIFIGNIAFLLNFFIGLGSLVPKILIFIILLINFFNKIEIKDRLVLLISNIIIPSILSISAYNIGFHYDAGYYHLNFQNWIINNKIVFGLSNIAPPLGLASVNDYISSIFWLENNFILLHFIQLASIAAFYTFLLQLFISQEKNIYKVVAVNILIFSILDNFGFGGGRNGFIYIQGIGKPDIIFSIIFFVSFLLSINLINKKEIKFEEFIYLNWLILFCFQIKVFGVLLLIPYISLIYKKRKFLIKKIKSSRVFYFQILIGLVWSLKSFILSGCLIFPVKETCIQNVRWFSNNFFEKFYMETKVFNKAFFIGDGIGSWFSDWVEVIENRNILFNFIISYLVIVLINFFISNNKNIYKKNSLYIASFVLFSIFILIVSSPLPRFLIPVFMIGISSINTDYEDIEKKVKSPIITYSKFIFIFFTLVSTFLLVRLDSHLEFINSPQENISIESVEIKYINNDHWGVGPENGDRCWINIKCTNWEGINPKIYNYFGYKYIELND